MSINRIIALYSATAAWYIGLHAVHVYRSASNSDPLRRKGSEFDAALGFDFMHLCLFRDGIEWW